MYRDTSDADFLSAVQEILLAKPDATQREMAARTGISLGLVNTWLSQLSERGWITAVPAGGRKIRYALTDAGAEGAAGVRAEKMRGDFAQMRRYAEAIAERIAEAKERGCTRVALYGESGIEFLIEYVCHQNGMAFETNAVPLQEGTPKESDGVLRIIGEGGRDVEPAEECLSVFELAGEEAVSKA